jgi:hypothetical protein
MVDEVAVSGSGGGGPFAAIARWWVVAVSGGGGSGPFAAVARWWVVAVSGGGVDGGVDGGCGVMDAVAVRWWAMRPCVVSRIY